MRAFGGFLTIVLASSLAPRPAAASEPTAPTAAYLQATTDAPASGGSAPAAPSPAPSPGMVSADVPPPGMVSSDVPPPGMTGAAPLHQSEVGVDTSPSYEIPSRSHEGRISGFMGWGFNVPLGSMRDFTAVVSPLGFEVQLHAWVTRNITLGVAGDWATYVDNRPRTTYSVDNAAVTATAYNYTQTSSARFLAHYYLIDDGPVLPYVGAQVGVTWSYFETQAADLLISDSEVSVAFGGEAGIEVPMGRNAPVALVNVRYSVAPAAEFRNVSNVQSLGLMLGIGF
jgi:hypothetical protein